MYGLVIQHEHQHVETMLQTIALRTGGRAYPLGPASPVPAAPVAAPEALVEGGSFVFGADDEPWAYDNELPAHEVELGPFWIDTTPVTAGAYRDFESGGYENPRWWSEPGWAWRIEAGLEHPHFWRREADGSWSVLRLGVRVPLDPDEPVQHVCWYEADAYARWAGKRLPTEAEWEKACAWELSGHKRRFAWGDEVPSPPLANLGARAHGPAPVSTFPTGESPWGCRQMIGDVWEWTASDFRPYQGFKAFPYREYSEVFFGSEYKVLRGGSWATHPSVARELPELGLPHPAADLRRLPLREGRVDSPGGRPGRGHYVGIRASRTWTAPCPRTSSLYASSCGCERCRLSWSVDDCIYRGPQRRLPPDRRQAGLRAR